MIGGKGKKGMEGRRLTGEREREKDGDGNASSWAVFGDGAEARQEITGTSQSMRSSDAASFGAGRRERDAHLQDLFEVASSNRTRLKFSSISASVAP